MLIALMAVAGLLFRDRLKPSESAPAGRQPAGRVEGYYGPSHSVAVLPLAASLGEHQTHLAEGFARELIELLQRVPELQVTAPASSFYFRDRQVPLQIVSARLHAAHILTGEYSEIGGTLRVSARLTAGRSGKDLWSGSASGPGGGPDSPHRVLADALLQRIGAGAQGPLPQLPSIHPEVRRRYLKGAYYRSLGGEENLRRAAGLFRDLTVSEPGYGAAWTGLAACLLALPEESVNQARQAVARALRIDSQDPSALALDSYIRRQHDWDWHGADRLAQHALAVAPGDAALMSRAGLSRLTLGRTVDAIALLEDAVRRDPLNLATRVRLGIAQEFAGAFDAALATHRQVANLNPQFPGIYAYRSRIKLLQGKAESALEEAGREKDPFWSRYARILALTGLGRQAEAGRLLERMKAENGEQAAFQIAEIFAFGGRRDLAFTWLERAREQRDRGMSELLGNRFLASLHDDPRWTELLLSLDLPVDPNDESSAPSAPASGAELRADGRP